MNSQQLQHQIKSKVRTYEITISGKTVHFPYQHISENWKNIPEFPTYAVSSRGRVFSCRFDRLLKPSLQSGGYFQVCLRKDKQSYLRLVHRLVAEAFCLSEDEDEDEETSLTRTEIDHIDRNPANNNACNLRWCNRAQNKFNSKTYKNNKIGVKGVRRVNKNSYQAYISIDGVQPASGH